MEQEARTSNKWGELGKKMMNTELY